MAHNKISISLGLLRMGIATHHLGARNDSRKGRVTQNERPKMTNGY